MAYLTLKYIPNTLTICRLFLILPFLMALYSHNYLLAFELYFLAGVTDALDGWLARYFHWKTFFGSFLDPLADKLLISCSFISLALLGELPWWLVILVFLRDFTIAIGVAAWYFFIRDTLQFKPTALSKINTSLQLVLVTVCLFQLAFFDLSIVFLKILIILTALTTSITYLNYVWTWSKKAYSVNHAYK